MSLKYALLGFLNYGPMTGYELKKSFDVSIAHFWNAELSQIYPTLKQLESEDLVEMEVQPQTERPNRKVYSITEDGLRELVDWLATPAPADAVREPLLIKLFLGAALPKDELLAVLRQRIDDLRATLKEHGPAPAHAQQFAEAMKLDREAFFWRAATEAYLGRLQAEVSWLEETVRGMEQGVEPTGAPARAKRKEVDARSSLRTLRLLAAEHLRSGGDVGRTNQEDRP